MSEADTAMSDPTGSFADWVSAVQHRTESALDRFLPQATIAPARLHDAMRYAVLGGGKRVRPLLCHAAGALSGASAEALDAAACAVEMIHAYSLVHDDMPCMDDDVLRRGKPTVHVQYDEATALLVGDSLQSLAFLLLSEHCPAPAETRAALVSQLAIASGSRGMAGGQAIDLASVGLPLGVEVVAGAIDTSAAAVGAGTVEDYLPHLYIGTSSWLSAHVPFKKTDIFSSMASVPCALPGRYLLTALQATAGGNLTYLRDQILYHKDELLQEADVPDIFKVLDQIAARVPPGANGVLYTPWIWGERAPVDDRNLRAGLYNIALHNTREDVIRAFLEGIALNTRWLMSPVEKFLGRKVARIHIVGGGAQSDVWCQIFADALGVEICQVSEPVYANARGAAWIAAAGLGEIRFADVPRLVQFQHQYTPDPRAAAVYTEKFEVFQQIYRQMKGVYKRLNG